MTMKTQIVTDTMYLDINQEQTIDSDTLLEMVNEVRLKHGKKPVRNNDFIARIKHELDGETYEIFIVQNVNNTTSEKAVIRVSQAIRVAARSKVVLRSLT
ncbi:hypothetical protein AABH71_002088 [Salmonella enterica]|nr:hypothetical protein [Salmonella enterica]EBQ9001289.1 hypothetical protein [Salmonella enterica subsp. enterica serovar Blockley]ECU7993229.1 hypothetical protein [Salmonella enterica subsp. enterica serovar Toucra]ECW2125350.1 hypothetical protein [Salmonella enterica]